MHKESNHHTGSSTVLYLYPDLPASYEHHLVPGDHRMSSLTLGDH